jgi:predicted esterase
MFGINPKPRKMKTFPYLAAVLILCACNKDVDRLSGPTVESNNTYDAQLETAIPTHTPRTVQINGNVAGYYETLPALYSKTTKRYPLIIFLHGIGELASNKPLSGLNCCGLPRHAYKGTFPAKFYVNGAYYSFIVISPQFRWRASANDVQSVIDYAKAKYRVDASRVYVTGLSLGGGEVLDWSMMLGEKAAAIVPVCPGTGPTTSRAQQIASKNLPIWFLYGDADAAIDEQQGITWHNLIDQYNPAYAPHTKLTIKSGYTHNGIWSYAFDPINRVDGKNIYEWLLQYRRDANNAPIARAGDDRVIPLSWNYMPTVYGTTSTDSDGWIAAFKWVQISGPTAAEIAAPAAGKTKITGLALGSYTFKLTVADNKGATSADYITITMTK